MVLSAPLCPRVPSTLLVRADDPTHFLLTGCRSYVCPVCGPAKVMKSVRAASWVCTEVDRPRFVTLTLAPANWQVRRQKVRDLARSLRGDGFRTEWWWTTEVGKRTGMVHVHMVQHGDYIPQRTLARKWGHRVDIRSVSITPGTVTGYMAKSAVGVTGYMAKGAQAGFSDWLELNGGRPFHQSRGFFLGLGIEGAAQRAREASGGLLVPSYVPLDRDSAEAWWALRAECGDDRDEFRVRLESLPMRAAERVSRSQDVGYVDGSEFEMHFVGT